jgi:choice-of-anchor A domain-containing protein
LLTTQYGGQVGIGGTGSIYTNQTPVMNDGGFTSAGVRSLSQSGISSFSADATEYTNLSSSLGALTANDTVSSSNGGGTLQLTTKTAGLNVFSISASALAAANTVDISGNGTVLIDVTGTSATLPSGMVFFSNSASASKVLYNFYQATSVTLTSSNPEGSILAPLAGVTGTYGAVSGQLIAASYSGETEFESTPFTGNLTPVPLPASVWLLCSALLAGLSAFRLKHARSGVLHLPPA